MTTLRSLVAVLLVITTAVVGPVAALAQETEKQPSALAPASTPPLGAFGLGSLSGPWPDHFLLFPDYWVPEISIALNGVPTTWGGATGPLPQRLVGLRSFGLAMRIGEEVGPDGRRRLVFAPLHRDWDDLSGWEKFGLTLQYAGAAAAIGHFVGKLVD